MKYLYLLINFCTIIVPFLFSFHPKLKFHKTWKAFFPAVMITGTIFVVWDIFFTRAGIWGFNPRYVSGVYVMNLPIEEILFFICIPYACVFTFHCLDIFIKTEVSFTVQTIIGSVLILFLIGIGTLAFQQLYTSVTFFSFAALLFIAHFILKIQWLGKFYLIYLVLLIPFFIVNGILTGTGLEQPVVWYNNDENLGARIGTVPFEDIFYGMELVLMNTMLYRWSLNKL